MTLPTVEFGTRPALVPGSVGPPPGGPVFSASERPHGSANGHHGLRQPARAAPSDRYHDHFRVLHCPVDRLRLVGVSRHSRTHDRYLSANRRDVARGRVQFAWPAHLRGAPAAEDARTVVRRFARGGSVPPGHPGPQLLPGVQAARRAGFHFLSVVPDAIEADLRPLRAPAGAALEDVPVLWHERLHDATDRGRQYRRGNPARPVGRARAHPSGRSRPAAHRDAQLTRRQAPRTASLAEPRSRGFIRPACLAAPQTRASSEQPPSPIPSTGHRSTSATHAETRYWAAPVVLYAPLRASKWSERSEAGCWSA